MLERVPFFPAARSAAKAAPTAALSRLFAPLLLMLLMVLVASGCSALGVSAKSLSAETNASRDGTTLEVDGVRISLPGVALVPGTRVSLTRDPADVAPAVIEESLRADWTALRAVSDPIQVTVGTPLADRTSMNVRIAVDPEKLAPGPNPGPASLALAHRSSPGSPVELIRVAWNAEARHVSAEVKTDGTFWAVQADVPALLAQTSIAMTAAAARAAKPDCADRPVEAAGVKFTSTPPAGTWVCLREHNDLLVVSLTTDSAMPLHLAAAEKPAKATTATLDALPPYFGAVLGSLLTPAHAAGADRNAAMAGTTLEYATAAAGVDGLELALRPYPAMFLLNFLSSMVEATMDGAIDPGAIDTSRTAQCTGPLLDSGRDHTDLDATWARPFTAAFMDCIAGTVQINPRMDVLLGALNAAQDLVAEHAMTLWSSQLHPGGSALSVKGEMLWTSYTGTLNDATISFDHPVGWTVMDGSVNQQFAQSNTVVLYDRGGNRKATLTVLDSFHASPPAQTYPARELSSTPGNTALSAGTGFEVKALAADLTGHRQTQTSFGWSNNVRLTISASEPWQSAVPDTLAPESLLRAVLVETGVRSGNSGQTRRMIQFSQSVDFATLQAAESFTGTAEFAALRTMIASLKG